MAKPYPKEPYREFAEWKIGSSRNTVYVEDANGHLWAGGSDGWSRIQGTRTEVEEAIKRGTWKYRGELIRKSNPIRRGSFPKGRTPPHLRKYLFKKGHR